jgi:hypothetical protein
VTAPRGFEPHRRERRLREALVAIEAEKKATAQQEIRERLAAELKARFAPHKTSEER